MSATGGNRFEEFFQDDLYAGLKNHLYNYLLRRHAVRRSLKWKVGELILEVGSGISPMTRASRDIVYSDLSFSALRALKRGQKRGFYVVADALHLPFRSHSFSQVICSEVLEHLPDDISALREIASVTKPGGSLILTFPHRRFYYASDDRFVRHYRRYELTEMLASLDKAGLKAMDIRKVLGPLDKLTMVALIALMPLFGRFGKSGCDERSEYNRPVSKLIIILFDWLNRLYCVPVWLEARLMPRYLSTILLIRADRPL